MKKSIFALGFCATAALFLYSCKGGSGSFKTTKNGLQYNIVDDQKGNETPKEGDIITLHLLTKVGDSIVFDSRKMNGNEPVSFPLNAPTFNGDVPEGIMLMSKGDSAIFKIPIDSIAKQGAQLMPNMKLGDFIVYHVRLVDFKTADAAKAEAAKESEAQLAIDDKILQDYFTSNGLKPNKTATGLYYIIDKEGTGENAKPGDMVSVMYTGKTLQGVKFDSNIDPKKPAFSFKIGAQQAIAGWDEGLTYFKKGGKGRLYVPSSLAYGPNAASPEINANEILAFDIEVADIQK